MKNEPHKKTVAVFLLAGLILLSALILKNVLAKILPHDDNLAVMYFSESISGLTVGAPVVYEGVQVGKVVKIEILTNPQTLEFSIPVYVRFETDGDISGQVSSDQELSRSEVLRILIEKGLRARLTTQNLLTGQLMIELLMLPESPVVFKQIVINKHLFEIPTTLSTLAGLSRNLEDMPLKQIVFKTDRILNILEEKLPPLLETYTDLGNKMNKYFDQSVPQTDQTLNRFNETVKDVGMAARSLKNLTDYLEQYPDSILKGKREEK